MECRPTLHFTLHQNSNTGRGTEALHGSDTAQVRISISRDKSGTDKIQRQMPKTLLIMASLSVCIFSSSDKFPFNSDTYFCVMNRFHNASYRKHMRIRNSSLCNFLHSLVTSYSLTSNIFLRSLTSDNINLCSSLTERERESETKFHTHKTE